jgi:hypothetical protein
MNRFYYEKIMTELKCAMCYSFLVIEESLYERILVSV